VDEENDLELTPKVKLRESEVLLKYQNLLNSEKSRYELQAQQLLVEGFLHTKIEGLKRTYFVNENTFRCNIYSSDSLGSDHAMELPIPGSHEDKIQILVELFAQSEAGLIS
jgi:hypothetical protein